MSAARPNIGLLIKMEFEYRNRKTVLIIDDDPAITESTRLALEAFGYDVQTAGDGATGLALTEERKHLFRYVFSKQICVIHHKLGVDAYIRKPFPMETLIAEVQRLLGDA